LHLYEKKTAIRNPKDLLHENRNTVADFWKIMEESLQFVMKELKKKNIKFWEELIEYVHLIRRRPHRKRKI
jgi:hypothetical protein